MKIFVKVKTKAKIEKVEKIDESRFNVWVKEIPIKGRANQAVQKLLSSYFGVSKSQIEIVSGQFSSFKVIEIRG